MVYENVQPAEGAVQAEEETFKRGTQVVYWPPHVRKRGCTDVSHPLAEFGFVTRVLEKSSHFEDVVVVAFWREGGEVYTAGCYTWCLTPYQSKPQNEVAEWFEKTP